MPNFFTSAYKYLNALVRLNLGLNLKFPLMVYLELTKKCNLRCKFCDIWKKNPNTKEELSITELKALFDEAKAKKTQLITLGGGEPFLRKDISEIIKELSRRELRTSITTNGTLIPRKEIKELSRTKQLSFNFSIDGPSAEIHDELRRKKGTFNKATNTIRLIKQYAPHIKVNISIVLNQRNYNLLPEMLKLCEELDVAALNVLPIHKTYPQSICGKQEESLFFTDKKDTEKLKKEIIKFKSLLSKSPVSSMSDAFLDLIPYRHLMKKFLYHCFGGNLFCEINYRGDVFPCYGKPKVMGNIKQESLSSIWAGEKAANIRKELKNCSSCFQNCYTEPSLRLSPLFLLKNPFNMLKEYRLFLR